MSKPSGFVNYTLGQKVDYYRIKSAKYEREIQIIKDALREFIALNNLELDLDSYLSSYKEAKGLNVL